MPNLPTKPPTRISKGIVDIRGHVSLRYLGKLRHLNVGRNYVGQTILLFIVDDHVGVVTKRRTVGEITINPKSSTTEARRNTSATLHWRLQ